MKSLSRGIDRIALTFDEDNLVANAGLLLVATVVKMLGIEALVNARVALVTAQHDRVVASYGVLAAVGRLSPHVLGLPTSVYDPMVHYQQVRDSWYGVRTPDGH